ncbi:MAG: sterol desaturase family protein [Bdellovibrionales bacterium]|nr:sterol desaturase family protein [Bdellovibrionales bacterium]
MKPISTPTRTWIESNQQWLKVLASPHPGWNAVIVVPILALLVRHALISFSGAGLVAGTEFVFLRIAISFFAGILAWTFFEYAVHRWVYHGKIRGQKLRAFVESFHIYHHREMEDPRVITAGPLMILPLSAGILIPSWFLLGADFGVFGAGFVCAYYFYEWVHFLIHRSTTKNPYIRYIRKYHLHHHDHRWDKCFGNTSSLWDHLLGTYDRPTDGRRSEVK